MTAVCDLWKVNREKAAATNAKYYGRAPRTFQYLEDVLALKDVDAVLISTPEHSHSPILKMAVEAGKDAYVEKPMGNVLAEAKAARDAAMKNNRMVQVGTQHRSEPYPMAAHESGADGRAWRRQQDRDCLELSRAALARASGNESRSAKRIRIGASGCLRSRIARLIRRCIASFVCTRNFPAAFQTSG